MDFVASQFLGFVFGILSSFIFWWVMAHIIVPRISFRPKLMKRLAKTASDVDSVHFKFVNVGRRPFVDVHIYARIRLKRDDEPDFSVGIRFALSETGEHAYHIPEVAAGANRVLPLFVHNSPDVQHDGNVTRRLRAQIGGRKAVLDDLFALSPTSKVVVYVAGYDPLSGARKVFKHEYCADDVVVGTFKPAAAAIAVAPLAAPAAG